MEIRQRLWLILPFWILYLADVTFTLLGQPVAYWHGDYNSVVEGNFIAKQILLAGPMVFSICGLAWALLIGIIVLFQKHIATTFLATILALLHAIGGSTWIIKHGGLYWLVAIFYLIAASEFSWYCWRRANLTAMQHGEPNR
jgi:CHASE2 domain-containing sensor protein